MVEKVPLQPVGMGYVANKTAVGANKFGFVGVFPVSGLPRANVEAAVVGTPKMLKRAPAMLFSKQANFKDKS